MLTARVLDDGVLVGESRFTSFTIEFTWIILAKKFVSKLWKIVKASSQRCSRQNLKYIHHNILIGGHLYDPPTPALKTTVDGLRTGFGTDGVVREAEVPQFPTIQL